MPYTPNPAWEDSPSVVTPITAAALQNIEDGVDAAHTLIDDHIADTADAHDASAVSVLDTAAQFTGTNVETVLAEVQDNLDTHLADTVDAHDASAVSVTPAGTIASTDVQTALQELAGDITAGGIPGTIFDNKGEIIAASAADGAAIVTAATADGLVLTSDAAQATGLKWAAAAGGASTMPDLTDVEAGPPVSGEAPVWTGSEFTFTDVATQTELDNHLNDTADAHDASAISILDTANDFTATDVEGALAELQADNEAHVAAADPHTGYVLESLIDAKGDLIVGSAADTVARLAKGNTGEVLAVSADSSLYWKAESGGSISAVTALPGSPADGDEILFMDSLTAPTYTWHLRYISGKSSNKWQFIGGSPMSSEVATSQTTGSTAYAALATAGPSIAVPVAGDYFVDVGFTPDGTDNARRWMSYDIGGTGAVDADATRGAARFSSVHRRTRKTGLTAVTLTAKYKAIDATIGFEDRWMHLTPIAIGG